MMILHMGYQTLVLFSIFCFVANIWIRGQLCYGCLSWSFSNINLQLYSFMLFSAVLLGV